MKYNDYEINSLDYNEALKFDKRTYFQYYLSILRMKHILIFTFCAKNDYNLRIIKISLFLFSFALNLTVNSLFFNDSTMHKILEDKGNYNFIFQIPQILYSSLISTIISIIVTNLSLTEKKIIKFKNETIDIEKKFKNLIKCFKIKFSLFYIIKFTFLLFFWYYLSSFCAVYKNTQIHVVKDTLICFSLSLFYPFFIYLLPGIFRILSLKKRKKLNK